MEPKYTAGTNLSIEDFRRYAKDMQGDHPKGMVLTILALLWILYSGIVNIKSGKMVLGCFMIAVVFICPLIYFYTARRQSKRYFEKLRENGGASFTVLFFDDHFETQGEKSQGSYLYKDLHAVIETADDFYLEVEAGRCVIVQKKNCSEELTAFLREIRKNT